MADAGATVTNMESTQHNDLTPIQTAYNVKGRVYAQAQEGSNFVTYALRAVVEFLPSGLTRNRLNAKQGRELANKIDRAGAIDTSRWTPVAVNGERIGWI